MFVTPKRRILAQNLEFWRILRQNPSGALAVASCKHPPPKKKTNTFWCAIWRAKSRMRGNETPGRIVSNFCTGVEVHDVITSANFYDSRVRGFGVVGGQILGFSIDLHRRPYNTLVLHVHYVRLRACPSVVCYVYRWCWITRDRPVDWVNVSQSSGVRLSSVTFV